MKERIRQLMELKNMTQQSFAEYIEMSPASLCSIFKGRTKPTLNIVEAIKRKFPNISTDWLMFGIGDMNKSSQTLNEAGVAGEKGMDDSAIISGDDVPSSEASPTSQEGIKLTLKNESKESANDMNTRIVSSDIVQDGTKYIDRKRREITEIRVYFDDLTFETFVPAKK